MRRPCVRLLPAGAKREPRRHGLTLRAPYSARSLGLVSGRGSRVTARSPNRDAEGFDGPRRVA